MKDLLLWVSLNFNILEAAQDILSTQDMYVC